MKSKVTIIGAGSVGSTIAYTLSTMDIASTIVLIDINKKKVEGEVMDIAQGTCFRDPISLVAGEYEDAKDSDIVIITSGIARKPGQTRIELTQTNVNIMKSIAPEIAKVAPNALYVIVSNPVDIMTYVFTKISGIPENQIIGSGTLLDTARLRNSLSEHFQVAQGNIHAYVFGEHGDSEFVAWSSANVSGVPLHDFCEMRGHFNHEEAMERLAEGVKNSAYEIIEKKKATYYGIAMSVRRVCEAIVRDEKSILPVSSMQHGSYGVDGVALSLPAVVGKNGVETIVPIKLNEEEIVHLRSSAETLKQVIHAEFPD